MINHNVPNMSLVELDEGEIALPGENGVNTFESNLRQFMILTRRAYNLDSLYSLADEEGIKLTKHFDPSASIFANPSVVFDSSHKNYFGITLKFSPIDDFDEFVTEDGDNFFNSLLHIVSFCGKRKLTGKRAAFIREFRMEKDPALGNVLVSKIVISTSIFYNDYRVTSGYPSTQTELDEATEEIFNKIHSEWGSKIKISLENEFV